MKLTNTTTSLKASLTIYNCVDSLRFHNIFYMLCCTSCYYTECWYSGLWIIPAFLCCQHFKLPNISLLISITTVGSYFDIVIWALSLWCVLWKCLKSLLYGSFVSRHLCRFTLFFLFKPRYVGYHLFHFSSCYFSIKCAQTMHKRAGMWNKRRDRELGEDLVHICMWLLKASHEYLAHKHHCL